MDTKKSIYEDEILDIPFDIVKLPSEAKLYGGDIPDAVGVDYVTAMDEDTLYSDSISNEYGGVFDVLIADKMRDKNININNLLLGDYNQILMFLRKTAFGKIYYTNTLDPDTGKYIKAAVDLDKLKRKPIGANFDENGEFEYHLEVMNRNIKFKLITLEMSNYINKTAQANVNDKGVIPYLTTRLTTQITSINGERDKIFISKFAKVMNPQDRLDFMSYVDKISPGVDLNYEFESSIKNTKYLDKVILGLDFFYPKSPISL